MARVCRQENPTDYVFVLGSSDGATDGSLKIGVAAAGVSTLGKILVSAE